MPFARRVDPELARFLAATSRGVAVAAAVFSVAVTSILVANAAQIAALRPLESPALAALRERYQSSQDEELALEIRALDLAARRTWFTRAWQSRSAAWMLAVGTAVLLASLRLAGSLAKRLPQVRSGEPAAEEGRAARAARTALAAAGVVLLAAGLSASVLTTRWLQTAAPEAANGSGRPSGRARGAAADRGPGIAAAAEFRSNWPLFRGPGGDGVAAPQDPPVDWDGATGRNVLWKTGVPLEGRSSPVVWQDRVFLSGAHDQHHQVFCWDYRTGKLLWSTQLPADDGVVARLRVGADTGWAASTMAVNGTSAFAIFAGGDLAALDREGAILWTVRLGDPVLNYGYASSLALYGDTVIVQLDQQSGGRLLAVDASSGKVAWETSRAVSASWSSPAVVQTPAGWRIFCNGTPFLAAYDTRGTQLWSLEGMLGENAVSPAYADGLLFVSNQLLSLVAVDAQTGAKLWEVYDDFPDVSSPLAAAGLVWMTSSYGVVSCLDAKNGAVTGRRLFDTGFYASPILAGGRVYALDRSGVMRIFAADRTLELIGSPSVGERTDATPAFQDGRIFIRGERTLFCIGKTGSRDGPK